MNVLRALGGIGATGAAILQFGVSNVDLMQSIVLPLAFTLAPRVEWLNETLLQNAAVYVTAVVVGLTIFQLVDRARERF